MSGSQDDSNVENVEIELETLQNYSFEIIQKSLKIWRSFRETDKGKTRKINLGLKIHQMIIDAMRFHPDIKHIKEMTKFYEEVKEQYEIAKKAGMFNQKS